MPWHCARQLMQTNVCTPWKEICPTSVFLCLKWVIILVQEELLLMNRKMF